MATRTAHVTVGTTPVKMTGEDDSRLGQRVLFRPVGGDIFIGGPDVTPDIGFLVANGEAFDDETDAPIYAVAAANVTVHVYRGGVA